MVMGSWNHSQGKVVSGIGVGAILNVSGIGEVG